MKETYSTPAEFEYIKDKKDDNHKNKKKGSNSNGKEEVSFFKSLLIDLLIAFALAFLIINIIRPTIVKQTSMQNTFQPNDYVFMYKLAYIGDKTPQRGDVVIFKSELVNEETGDDKLLIKRVIGLPGDEIVIKNNQLYLNGEAYYEDYIKDGITTSGDNPSEAKKLIVPQGEYYCMGDNRLVSLDSRYKEVGTIKESQIEGKAVIRLYPFDKIKTF